MTGNPQPPRKDVAAEWAVAESATGGFVARRAWCPPGRTAGETQTGPRAASVTAPVACRPSKPWAGAMIGPWMPAPSGESSLRPEQTAGWASGSASGHLPQGEDPAIPPVARPTARRVVPVGRVGSLYLIGGGCSDDAFTDFRAGIIAQGRDWYEKVAASPIAWPIILMSPVRPTVPECRSCSAHASGGPLHNKSALLLAFVRRNYIRKKLITS